MAQYLKFCEIKTLFFLQSDLIKMPANSIPFEEICELLENLHKRKKQRQKQEDVLCHKFDEFKQKISNVETTSKKVRCLTLSTYLTFQLVTCPRFDKKNHPNSKRTFENGSLVFKFQNCKGKHINIRNQSRYLRKDSHQHLCCTSVASTMFFLVDSRRRCVWCYLVLSW